MSHREDAELHTEKFQKERIALFSDAVFAIAITLLIIEIKVPEPENHEISDSILLHELLVILPKIIGFLVSFMVIGLYWAAHHRLFRYIIKSTPKLLFANLLFLLPIVTMPFSTAFLSEYFYPGLHLPLAVYTFNICVTGLCSYRLWKIVANPKNELSRGISKPLLSYNLARARTIPIAFVVVLLLSYLNSWLSIAVLPFVIFITLGIKRYYRRKYAKDPTFISQM